MYTVVAKVKIVNLNLFYYQWFNVTNIQIH